MYFKINNCKKRNFIDYPNLNTEIVDRQLIIFPDNHYSPCHFTHLRKSIGCPVYYGLPAKAACKK